MTFQDIASNSIKVNVFDQLDDDDKNYLFHKLNPLQAHGRYYERTMKFFEETENNIPDGLYNLDGSAVYHYKFKFVKNEKNEFEKSHFSYVKNQYEECVDYLNEKYNLNVNIDDIFFYQLAEKKYENWKYINFEREIKSIFTDYYNTKNDEFVEKYFKLADITDIKGNAFDELKSRFKEITGRKMRSRWSDDAIPIIKFYEVKNNKIKLTNVNFCYGGEKANVFAKSLSYFIFNELNVNELIDKSFSLTEHRGYYFEFNYNRIDYSEFGNGKVNSIRFYKNGNLEIAFKNLNYLNEFKSMFGFV